MNKMMLRTLTVACFVLSVAWSTADAQSLPSAWASADIGPVGATGNATGSGGSFTVAGAGADIWGGVDAFRFAYSQLTGDGSIVTRVQTLDALSSWTKAGVMMRDTLAANSPHALMLASPAKGLAFQRRVIPGGDSANTGASGTAPRWLKLTRAGNVFTASQSSDGANWTTVGSDTISMGSTIYVGVAVSSHVTGVLASASFASTVVTAGAGSTTATPVSTTSSTTSSSTTSASTSLPGGWSATDIGAVGTPGTASGSGTSFSVSGAGADVWGTADALRFAYTQLTGDGSIAARVDTVDNLNAWTKAGVMIRETLAANARHAFMLVSPGKGLAFQRRQAAGGDSVNTAGGGGAAPYWVKLTRSGSSIAAYKSADGSNWTLVGSDSIAMGSTVYVGLAVSSHVAGVLAQATFSSAAVAVGAVAAPAPPPPPPSSTSTSVRVLHWNVHHGGIGMDGVYNPGRIADWIKTANPDIASLNEVDTDDQVVAIVDALKARTGVNWYTSFSGLGNLVISRLPLNAASKCLYPNGVNYAAHLGVIVNGRNINLWSTHLTVDSASARLAEVGGLQTCAESWPEAHILAGDYNMQEGSTEYQQAVVGYNDGWLTAKALGTTTNFAGNCDGCTRNSRIDYVFSSKAASFLVLRSAQIFDTRDGNGYAASDHKPMLIVYGVN